VFSAVVGLALGPGDERRRSGASRFHFVATVLVVCFRVDDGFLALGVGCCVVDARVVRVGELPVVEVVDPLRTVDPVLVVREVDVGFAVDFLGVVVVVGAGSGAGSGFGVGPAASASSPENATTSTARVATTRRAMGALGDANLISPPETALPHPHASCASARVQRPMVTPARR
jgi:hypothetical protein